MRGMLVHLDGSTHEWLPARPGEKRDLVAFLDDADGRILFADFFDEEGTDIITTPKKNTAKDLDDTQVERALRSAQYQSHLGQFSTSTRTDGAFFLERFKEGFHRNFESKKLPPGREHDSI